ncbi:SPASM domain-containing protein [Candidatus Poribacteria bacterium]|nr:SPASM domain-containing protein [Candidatus Poribacteria bacterium]
MASNKNLIKVDSDKYISHINNTLTHLWQNEISNTSKSQIISQLTDLLKQQKIEYVTPDDINLIITSAISKAFMHPLNYMELFLTENCNLRCDYCFVHGKNEFNRMTQKVAFEAVDLLISESGHNKTLDIVFFGGEPLLESDLIRSVVEYAEPKAASIDKKINFSATTNGTIFDEDILKLSQGRINYLISMDGDRETHDQHRRDTSGVGSYDTITEKLDMVKSYQPWLGVRMTVYPDTANKLEYNVSHLFSLGFNQFIICPSYGPYWSEDAISEYESQLDKVGIFYLNKKREKAPIRMTFFESDSNSRFCVSNIWGCHAGRNAVTVATNGNLYPCSKFIGLGKSKRETYCFGNVSTGITDLEIRDEFENIGANIWEECKICDAADYCTGGCPANNYNDTGSVSQPSPFDCQLARLNRRVLKRFEKALD